MKYFCCLLFVTKALLSHGFTFIYCTEFHCSIDVVFLNLYVSSTITLKHIELQ